MSEMNGHDTPPLSADQQQQMQSLNDLNAPIRQVVGTMIRGLLVSCPGVPPHVILSVVAWQTGNLIADAMVADLKTQFELRKTFKDSFHDGVKQAPLRQPEVHGGQPMTSPIKIGN